MNATVWYARSPENAGRVSEKMRSTAGIGTRAGGCCAKTPAGINTEAATTAAAKVLVCIRHSMAGGAPPRHTCLSRTCTAPRARDRSTRVATYVTGTTYQRGIG